MVDIFFSPYGKIYYRIANKKTSASHRQKRSAIGMAVSMKASEPHRSKEIVILPVGKVKQLGMYFMVFKIT
jgi:hypothetical protein